MRKKPYEYFSAREIEPRGWLKNQLRLQADGLSGNLQKVWPDVANSQWIGGDCEGWERVPYWLDGFVPLAYLLRDEALISDAKRYIDGILSLQRFDPTRPTVDGWICPVKNDIDIESFDVWAVFLLCKAFIVYYECSGDERIPDAIYAILKNLKFHLEHFGVRSWASYRWYEALISLLWMYERRPEEWLIDIAHNLDQQCADYKKIFRNWKGRNVGDSWTLGTHVVNMAMAMKSEALYSFIREHEGEEADPDAFAEEMFQNLMKYHGNGIGHFNGDECISGTSPSHGTELCGVVEAMFTYEQLFLITGKEKWLERAEALAFNSLPAGLTEDMWARQYNQMLNQIFCGRYDPSHRPFLTNGIDGGLFGLEPNYGCCTANFNQGWPKFALSAFARSEKGITSAVIVPAALRTEFGGANVEITVDTEYPFKGRVKYTVKTDRPVEFEFGFRVPSCVTGATVDSKEAAPGMQTISRVWDGETVIEVELKLAERFSGWSHPDLVILQRGPIYFSLPLDEKWERLEYEDMGIVRKYPYCDYLLTTDSEWQFGFASDKVVFHEESGWDLPFTRKHPPVWAEVELAPIDWGYKDFMEGQVACDLPKSTVPTGEKRTVKMLPYGIPKLRMTALPMLEK